MLSVGIHRREFEKGRPGKEGTTGTHRHPSRYGKRVISFCKVWFMRRYGQPVNSGRERRIMKGRSAEGPYRRRTPAKDPTAQRYLEQVKRGRVGLSSGPVIKEYCANAGQTRLLVYPFVLVRPRAMMRTVSKGRPIINIPSCLCTNLLVLFPHKSPFRAVSSLVVLSSIDNFSKSFTFCRWHRFKKASFVGQVQPYLGRCLVNRTVDTNH